MCYRLHVSLNLLLLVYSRLTLRFLPVLQVVYESNSNQLILIKILRNLNGMLKLENSEAGLDSFLVLDDAVVL